MTFKKRCLFLALFVSLLLWNRLPAFSVYTIEGETIPGENPKALLFFDGGESFDGSREEILSLYKQLRAVFQEVETAYIRNWEAVEIEEGTSIILAGGRRLTLEESFIKLLSEHSPAVLWVGPKKTKAPVPEAFIHFDTSSQAAEYLRMGLSQSREPSGVYLTLYNVSPLCDLDALLKASELLKKRNSPFAAEIRPVFQNTDYASMEVYTNVLKALQEAGGTFVLGNLGRWRASDIWDQSLKGEAPLSSESEMVPEKLMETAFLTYKEYGIYPVGFGGPTDLFFDRDMAGMLDHFGLYLEVGSWHGMLDETYTLPGWKGKFIPAASQLKGSPVGSVFGVDVLKGLTELEEVLENLDQNRTVLLDLRETAPAAAFSGNQLSAQPDGFYLNGMKLGDRTSLTPAPTESPAPTPVPEAVSVVNEGIRRIIVVVLIMAALFLILFTGAFIQGKRLDRRKYLR